MKLPKIKFFSLLLSLVLILFFSNDFGLVNIEKTAIITAIAIDVEEEEYLVTAQVAVPEATTATTENKKAEIIGKGKTVGSAIRNIGELSGWYPQLAFCNLIILGSSTINENVIKLLDYFTKTLRVQDSAVVVLAENKASDIISTATPLDNISSFAIQKILLKDLGFELGVATNDIRSFCIGYYSESGSSYMPIIKNVEVNEEETKSQGGQGSSSGGQSSKSSDNQGASTGKGTTVFDASTTALFLHGKKVGELTKDQTLIYNALYSNLKNSTIQIEDVKKDITSNNANYMLTIARCTPKIDIKVEENKVIADFSLNIYCKVSDQTSEYSDDAFNKNVPLAPAVKRKTEEYITSILNELIETEKQTGCDFLKIKQRLYRFHYKDYAKYKDNLFSVLTTNVFVNVSGQK